MKYFVALFLAIMTFVCQATIKAVTDEGEVVLLYADGSWEYENKQAMSDALAIKMNTQIFKKPDSATFVLKSKNTNAVIHLEPKIWSFQKNDLQHQAAEYTFKAKQSDLYGMLITEKLQVPLENLINIALQNAKNAAPDAHIVEKEYRMVNGHKVIFMRIEGTIQNIKFAYLSYYFTNESGAVQFITYTGANLVETYKETIFDLLNGFDLQ